MRQGPVSSIINEDGGNASFITMNGYKACYNLGISK